MPINKIKPPPVKAGASDGGLHPVDGRCSPLNGFSLVYNDGCLVLSDLRVVNNRITVPIRELIAKTAPFGSSRVEFSDADRVAWIFTQGTLIGFPWDMPAMSWDGVTKSIDASAYQVDGKTYVPLRAAMEALGMSVGYDDSTRTITLDPNWDYAWPSFSADVKTSCNLHGYEYDGILKGGSCPADEFLVAWNYGTWSAPCSEQPSEPSPISRDDSFLKCMQLYGLLSNRGVKRVLNKWAIERAGGPYDTAPPTATSKWGRLAAEVGELAFYYWMGALLKGEMLATSTRMLGEDITTEQLAAGIGEGVHNDWVPRTITKWPKNAIQYQADMSRVRPFWEGGELKTKEFSWRGTTFDGHPDAETFLEAKAGNKKFVGWLQSDVFKKTGKRLKWEQDSSNQLVRQFSPCEKTSARCRSNGSGASRRRNSTTSSQ